jgi:hypothetical protein
MENIEGKPVRIRQQIALGISVGTLVGLSAAAILNRILGFFFPCVFIGSLAGAITTHLLLSFKLRNNRLFATEYQNHSTIRFIAALLTSLILFSFLSTLPLNIDRSFSVWTLNQISNLSKEQTRFSLETLAEDFFTQENGEVSRRIDEQIKIGNLVEESNNIKLTSRGQFQVQFHRFIAKIFGLNSKYTEIQESAAIYPGTL